MRIGVTVSSPYVGTTHGGGIRRSDRLGDAGKAAVRGARPNLPIAASIKSLAEYQSLWDEAAADPEKFWADLAREELHWFEPFEKRWFGRSQLHSGLPAVNQRFVQLPRFHLAAGPGDRTAILWEGEPGDMRGLPTRNCIAKFAIRECAQAAWHQEGDRVSIYMPMVPELAIAMLACARIGAIHSVIFAGFSADAIADRNRDAAAKLQITADTGWRRGKALPLKGRWMKPCESPTVKKCVVFRREARTNVTCMRAEISGGTS